MLLRAHGMQRLHYCIQFVQAENVIGRGRSPSMTDVHQYEHGYIFKIPCGKLAILIDPTREAPDSPCRQTNPDTSIATGANLT